MAQSASIVWEVRTTGADTNGGGFKVGASGTDYSQQNSAQYALTSITSSGTGAVFLTAAAAANMVGNIAQVISGTNFTAGFYEITSVSVGVSVTVDRNCCSGVGASGVINIGGALASIVKLGTAMGTAGQWAFVKATGTYTQTASAVFTITTTPSNANMFNRLSGYTTTRGDGGKASITLSTNSLLNALDFASSQGWIVENFNIDCASLTTSSGISFGSSYYNVIRNCKVSNFKSIGIYMGTQFCIVVDCEVTGGFTGAFGIYSGGGACQTIGCWVHDNACTGIWMNGTYATIAWNLVTNNTGSGSDGIVGYYACSYLNNTVYNSGNYGINNSTNFQLPSTMRGNVIVNNAVAGVAWNSTGAVPAYPWYDGNAYYNNVTDRLNADLTTGITSVSPYTNVLDIALQGSPFVNAGANDFRLNNLPGRGLACKRVKGPVIQGTSLYNYMDYGCINSDNDPTPLTKNKKG